MASPIWDKLRGAWYGFRHGERKLLYDPLTGLRNTQLLEYLLGKLFAEAIRYEHPLTLGMLDMDGLKQLNDVRGHPVGNRFLRRIGKRLMKMARDSDVVIRYGGDEFLLALPETGEEAARTMIERLRAELGKQEIRFSYGLAELGEENSWEELLAKADAAMYRQKEAKKRNRKELSGE